jgi:hypothetical protein
MLIFATASVNRPRLGLAAQCARARWARLTT